MAESGEPNGAASTDTGGTQRTTRGRYAKFNGGMDVLLLEALREHNPFTAKHGTRLQMWQSIAEIVGEELFKNPEAYSWHTCRDRVTALMKMYTDGKHDKLFKHGSVEENARKEAILRELNLSIARKNKITIRPAASLLETSVAAASTASSAPSAVSLHSASVARSRVTPTGAIDSPSAGAASSSSSLVAVFPKRRRLESSGSSALTPSSMLDDAHSSSGGGVHHSAVPVPAPTTGTAAATHSDSDAFRARVLALMESKVAFDMEQRVKETALREQEIELQKRFLEYLQSK